tara:strand:+ start:159 stop:464 length:306 start_codon:yes stop_codon:yes gene_type:complete
MAGSSESIIDSLTTGVKKFQVGAEKRLLDYVGKDLFDIFYKKEIEKDLGFGIKSTVKTGDWNKGFEGRSISFRKENIFKNWDAQLDAERNKLMFKLSTDIR